MRQQRAGRRRIVLVLAGLLLVSALLPASGYPAGEGVVAAGHVALGAPTTQEGVVELRGEVEQPLRLGLDDLRALPSLTFANTFATSSGAETATYRGVLLWDLLQAARLKNTTGTRNDRLRKYVVATGADGYEVIVAVAELDPGFGGQHVLVAYERDGQLLDGREGIARLLVPGDKRGGRAVFGLTRLEVRDIDSPPRS